MTLPNSEDIQFNIIYDKENQQIGDAGTTDYLFFADADSAKNQSTQGYQ